LSDSISLLYYSWWTCFVSNSHSFSLSLSLSPYLSLSLHPLPLFYTHTHTHTHNFSLSSFSHYKLQKYISNNCTKIAFNNSKLRIYIYTQFYLIHKNIIKGNSQYWNSMGLYWLGNMSTINLKFFTLHSKLI
jgi:hypothetical protein